MEVLLLSVGWGRSPTPALLHKLVSVIHSSSPELSRFKEVLFVGN